MTSPFPLPAHIIGLMSGTSADGVDAALLCTDGQTIADAGESVFIPYPAELRMEILGLMQGIGDKARIARALTEIHIEAVRALQKKTNTPVMAVGFHGQTIRHAPEEGVTEQIGDAAFLADSLGLPVIFDFRTNDVKHGGQGAPLVPLYHVALAHALPKPLMVVNIGGVANVTWIGEDALLAFDCGPGNAMLDDWMGQHTGTRCDENGMTAASGTVDHKAVAAFLQHPFFAEPAPKSLDRLEFSHWLANYQQLYGSWNVQDGAATLTAMTTAAIAASLPLCPQKPQQLLITGGGRHNPTMMAMLQHDANHPSSHLRGETNLPPQAGGGIDVSPVEAVGWQGDMLEAQAFAYLAARSLQKLPLSLPSTTGVRQPITGGRVIMPRRT